MIATLVEGKELLQTVAASIVAGVGITLVFSVAIWGVGRFQDFSRDERPLAATAAAVTAGLAFACVGAAVVGGIIVVTHK